MIGHVLLTQRFIGARGGGQIARAGGGQVLLAAVAVENGRAVASSADRIKVEANLEKIGLPAAGWDALVTGEDIVAKKPAPDIFLRAAAELSQNPTDCVVVEDSRAGVKAALAAGMFVIPYRIGLRERHALVIGKAEDLNQVQGVLVARAKNNCE